MSERRVAIIQAPLAVERYWSGVDLTPERLLQAGLADRLEAALGAALPKADWTPRLDPATRMLNPGEVRDWLRPLAAAVIQEREAGRLPLVLGGDCTVLLGCLLGCPRDGGLLFVDGHADWYLPEQSPSGETADMDLSLALGRGPAVLAGLDPAGPLVDAGRTVVFGPRDQAMSDQLGAGSPAEAGALCLGLDEIRSLGFNNALGRSLERLEAAPRFWLHVDLDALDDATLPAVDYRMPGGLGLGELGLLIRRCLATGKVAGVDLTIFNPALDWDGSQTRLLVDFLASALTCSES